MVDLPEPDRPVNQNTAGRWFLASARSFLSTSSDCQWILSARLSGCRIMPAPTVALVMRSIRMKAPVARFSAKLSKASGDCTEMLQMPTSFISSDLAASRAKLLTLTRHLSSVTVALAWSVSVRNM